MESQDLDNPSVSPERERAKLKTLKNVGILLVLRLLIPIFSFALVVTLSRLLGAEGLGRYSLVFSFLNIFSGLGALGLGTVIAREGARDRSSLDTVLPTGLVLGVATAVLLTLVLYPIGHALNYDKETLAALLVMSLAIVPTTALMHIDGAFVALERMGYIAIAAIGEQIIKVGGGVLFLLLGYNLEAVLFTALASKFFALAICLYLLPRAGVHMCWRIEKNTVWMLLKLAPTFVTIVIFARLYWRIDIIMLSRIGTLLEVGFYGAAYRLYEFAAVLPQSLCLALYPQLALAFRRDPSKISTLGTTALRYLIAAGLPLAVCTTVLAKPILQFLYGEDFGDAHLVLSILIWTVLPYSVVRYYAHLLLAADLQRFDLAINIVMSTLNIGLNFVLIPRFGAEGAAAATLMSIVTYAILQQVVVRRQLHGHMSRLQLGPAVTLGTTMTGLVAWLAAKTGLVIALVSLPAVYVAVLLLAGFFSLSELKLLRLDRLASKLGLTNLIQSRSAK